MQFIRQFTKIYLMSEIKKFGKECLVKFFPSSNFLSQIMLNDVTCSRYYRRRKKICPWLNTLRAKGLDELAVHHRTRASEVSRFKSSLSRLNACINSSHASRISLFVNERPEFVYMRPVKWFKGSRWWMSRVKREEGEKRKRRQVCVQKEKSAVLSFSVKSTEPFRLSARKLRSFSSPVFLLIKNERVCT